MYVADQYAEREFYELLGFERHYEGDEFPGFLVIRHGSAIIGLQRSSDEHPPYHEGLRWQFELDTTAELTAIIDACVAHGLNHTVDTEQGGNRFRTRVVRLRSPNGVEVWLEGPNEANSAP